MDRRYLTREFLYTGPKVTCPCCDQSVDIRLASPLESPSDKTFIAPKETLEAIYSELRNRTQDRTYKDKSLLYVRCAQAIVTKHKDGGSSKLAFVDLCEGRIAGPFCEPCLKTFLRNRERPSGQQYPLRVYVATVNPGILRRLRLVAPEPQETEGESEFVDLF